MCSEQNLLIDTLNQPAAVSQIAAMVTATSSLARSRARNRITGVVLLAIEDHAAPFLARILAIRLITLIHDLSQFRSVKPLRFTPAPLCALREIRRFPGEERGGGETREGRACSLSLSPSLGTVAIFQAHSSVIGRCRRARARARAAGPAPCS